MVAAQLSTTLAMTDTRSLASRLMIRTPWVARLSGRTSAVLIPMTLPSTVALPRSKYKSASPEPGQPLPSALDFGQASVGVFPKVTDILMLLRGFPVPFRWS